MQKFIRRPLVVHAVQVTAEMVSGGVCGGDHVDGTWYDLVLCAVEFRAVSGRVERAFAGDWIVRYEDGGMETISDRVFRATYMISE